MPRESKPFQAAPKRLQMITCKLLIALLFVFVAGCGNPERHRLVGKWQLEEPTRLENRVTDVADLEAESKMTLEFRSGGRFFTQTAMGNIQQAKQGTWRVVDFDESKNVLRISSKIGDDSTEQAVEFLEEDLIQLVPPNMAGLTLKLKFRRHQ